MGDTNNGARPSGPGSREPSPSVSAASGFDPSREYEIECLACGGEGRVEHPHMPIHEAWAEAPEYAVVACADCNGAGYIWTDKPLTLMDCPPGLFVTMDGHVGFKTEYGAATGKDIGGGKVEWTITPWPDVYVVASGECFWGGAKTHEDRAALLVRPIDLADLREVAP